MRHDNRNNNPYGVVVIGRNEGERLRNCLSSVVTSVIPVVYVDSGSTDNSVNIARNMDISVVELDMSIPFTAARARNEGVNRLLELLPKIAFIQFVDGDCEVVKGWLIQAVDFLVQHPDVAVVAGRRRERHPEQSVYNLMCDIEWNTPIGQAKACGGDALMRVDAFLAAGGYRNGLIAGEEPELCLRMRALGWKIWRMDAEMVLHDAAMSRFTQWWKRALRAGHACEEGAYLHGDPPERHYARESQRVWFWGLGVPVFTMFVTILWGAWGAALALIYPAQLIRLALRNRKYSPAPWWQALFLVVGKFPEMLGQLRFVYSRLRGHATRLIEYK